MQSVELLQQAKWKIKLAAHPMSLNEGWVKANYAGLPPDYTHFIEQIEECTNQDATAWFISVSDFNGQSNTAFTWNEFEQQSVEAANGDEGLISGIEAFWSQHIPIIMSVKDGYAYIAISLQQEHHGRIVCGAEPEYEDASVIAGSFGELLVLLTGNLQETMQLLALHKIV